MAKSGKKAEPREADVILREKGDTSGAVVSRVFCYDEGTDTAYCLWRLKNGSYLFEDHPLDELEAVRVIVGGDEAAMDGEFTREHAKSVADVVLDKTGLVARGNPRRAA